MTAPVEPVCFTSTHTADFPDGSRVETVVNYYPQWGHAPTPVPTPEPQPPVPLLDQRIAGVHDARPMATVKALFPGTQLTRPFIAGVQTGPRSLVAKAENVCRPSWDAGLLPTYSLKLNRDEVMAGRWDPFIRELGDWHLDQPECELIIQHEPENDAELQGGAFPPYFNRISEHFRVANEGVPLLYAAMGYQWLPGSTNGTVKGFTSNPAHWQGVDADRYVIDLYSGNSVPLDTILPEHRGWQRWMEHIVGDGPWGVAERGFITDNNHAGRAAAIEREKHWLLTDPVGLRCRRYIYWNTSGTEKNPAIVVDAKHGEPAVRDLITVLHS